MTTYPEYPTMANQKSPARDFVKSAGEFPWEQEVSAENFWEREVFAVHTPQNPKPYTRKYLAPSQAPFWEEMNIIEEIEISGLDAVAPWY
jgi:hypothetical protein